MKKKIINRYYSFNYPAPRPKENNMLILLFRSLFLIAIAWIWTDFGLIFGSILAPFWDVLGLFLDQFSAPLRGAISGEKTRKTNVFHCSGAPGRLSFGVPFGLNFGSISASFLIPFCSIVFRPEPEEILSKKIMINYYSFNYPAPRPKRK